MADELDRAQELSDMFLAKALEEQQKNSGLGGISEEFCIDCDEEIPELRREMLPGVKRCVYCQELYEKRLKQFA